MRGRLFVFEGADSVGKSTLCSKIAKKIDEMDHPYSKYTFPGNEKGSLGYHIYQVHHNPTYFGLNSINPTSLQILHVAAHIDLIENRIQPDIKGGKILLLDRYWWSTFVYGKVTGVNLDSLKAMIKLEKNHWGNLKPSIVFYVDREQPLGTVKNLSDWKKIRREYEKLIQDEKAHHKIIRINNESSIDKTVDIILANIRRTIDLKEHQK